MRMRGAGGGRGVGGGGGGGGGGEEGVCRVSCLHGRILAAVVPCGSWGCNTAGACTAFMASPPRSFLSQGKHHVSRPTLLCWQCASMREHHRAACLSLVSLTGCSLREPAGRRGQRGWGRAVAADDNDDECGPACAAGSKAAAQTLT